MSTAGGMERLFRQGRKALVFSLPSAMVNNGPHRMLCSSQMPQDITAVPCFNNLTSGDEFPVHNSVFGRNNDAHGQFLTLCATFRLSLHIHSWKTNKKEKQEKKQVWCQSPGAFITSDYSRIVTLRG